MRQLPRIVGALGFDGFADQDHFRGAEFGGGGGEYIGQVVLALGVVVGQMRQPALQRGRFGGDDAGVDDPDTALFLVGVLLFDDRGDAAFGVAHDAAIAGRVGDFRDQHGEPPGRGEQTLQGFAADQRHVAVEDQHGGRIGYLRHGLFDCVAGAQLLFLFGPEQVGLAGEGLPHLFPSMSIHHMDAGRIQRARRGDDLGQHRLPGDRLQYLGPGRAHAFAFAGGEDDDVQGCGHVRSSDGCREPF